MAKRAKKGGASKKGKKGGQAKQDYGQGVFSEINKKGGQKKGGTEDQGGLDWGF